MVAVVGNRTKKGSSKAFLATAIVCGALLLFISQNHDATDDGKSSLLRPKNGGSSDPAISTNTDDDGMTIEQLDDQRASWNAAQMRAWRESLGTKQQSADSLLKSPVKKCSHVFLDFGSNIGDALHKMVESFFPTKDLDGSGEMKHLSFNETTGNSQPRSKMEFPVVQGWVKEKITKYNSKSNRDPVYPENYCFYGVEGNPYFTPMLLKQEVDVLNMSPRPVRHLHYLTEHVGTAQNGPTTLFLDTINKQNHYWGSSILQSHTDVKRSGEKTGVQVMGITLTTLLERSVAAGGHVMIKIDIEGAEYQLLEEAVKSGIFCKLVKELGVTVDVLGEFHHDRIIGSEEPRKRWEELRGEESIRSCGVDYEVKDFIISNW